MKKLFVAALLTTCAATAAAEAPSTNPMPDGSRDMYLGLGLASTPRYDGAAASRRQALPVVQIQWSNGVFLSGMSAGLHLSDRPDLEWGPLLALQPGRTASGNAAIVGGTTGSDGNNGIVGAPLVQLPAAPSANRLAGIGDIGARLQAGGFVNAYLSPAWRLAGNLLGGAGRDRDGVIAGIDLQRLALPLATHHTLSLSLGAAWVNGNYNRSYFGVTPAEAVRSGNRPYAPAGGLKEVRASARWNWALGPSWLLTSSVRLTRLEGDAGASPLVERRIVRSVSSALAYRF